MDTSLFKRPCWRMTGEGSAECKKGMIRPDLSGWSNAKGATTQKRRNNTSVSINDGYGRIVHSQGDNM